MYVKTKANSLIPSTCPKYVNKRRKMGIFQSIEQKQQQTKNYWKALLLSQKKNYAYWNHDQICETSIALILRCQTYVPTESKDCLAKRWQVVERNLVITLLKCKHSDENKCTNQQQQQQGSWIA